MFAFNFLIFCYLVASCLAARDFVPVLMWGPQPKGDSKSFVSGLYKLDTDDFFNHLFNGVKSDNANIVVFIEENLSLEDFSWKDVNEQGAYPLLSNLSHSAGDTSFFPSVRNPYKAIKKLVNHGYSWISYNDEASRMLQDDDRNIVLVKLSEPDSSEGRPELLRSHDIEIAKIYNNLLTYNSNLLGLYTGNHSSWMDSDVKFTRVKRNDQDNDTIEEVVTSDTLLLADSNKTVLMVIQKPIVFQNGSETKNLTITSSNPTIEKKKNKGIVLDVNFKYETSKLEIDFHFEGSEQGPWKLSYAVVNEIKDQFLIPSNPVEAPRGYSYHCGRPVTFRDKDNKVSLSFKNIQVQPYTKDGKFGTTIDCVPYFSIAIWSGLFIVLILTIVLAWGIMMIMDINTMDRFDDAKGKTITIAASD